MKPEIAKKVAAYWSPQKLEERFTCLDNLVEAGKITREEAQQHQHNIIEVLEAAVRSLRSNTERR